MKGATKQLKFEVINMGPVNGHHLFLVRSPIKISVHTALDVVLDAFAPESEVSDAEYSYLANNAEMTPPARIKREKRFRWAVKVSLPIVLKEEAAA